MKNLSSRISENFTNFHLPQILFNFLIKKVIEKLNYFWLKTLHG